MKKSRRHFPLNRIIAAIRRRQSERWMRRWAWYAAQNNVKPIHD